MGFSQALSGLNAAASGLEVQGNNIANSQTVGFKSSSAQFADVYANSKIGLGTKLSAVSQDFGNGNLENTGRTLDLGIAGEGFFRFEQNDQVVYSRNGQLSMTANGFLENAQGARLMGYGASGNNILTGGQPQQIKVDTDEMPANATTDVNISANLDSRIDLADGDATSVTLDDGSDIDYHFSSNFTVYDSLGNPLNATAYYEKTGNNTWAANVAVSGNLSGSATDVELSFDANGQLTAPETLNVTGDPGTGANPLDFEIDIAGFSQYGNESQTSDLAQNGYTSGAFVGISIENNGTVMRNYANEQSRPAGQIAMANFRNPEGLNPIGDNAWAATQASGQELVGQPGAGLLGSVESGTVESSNVDMAKELVNMIVTQRSYQANSQTIKTQDEVLQTAINLR